MLPATNLDLDKVLFASMVPIQEELSSGSGAGEVRTGSVDETSINYPMTLRLDAEQHGKNLGELYVNREKGEIYAKSSLGGPRQPRVWLVVQTSYMDVNNEHTFSRYWCKDIGNDSELTDEYGFVHVKLDDIVFGNNITKLSSLDNCKIWLEASFDNAANSASSAVYTYAVEPKPLPEVTVTTITKFFDPESGEELTSASSTETSTIHAGDTFTYSYKNKPYISPDKIVNNKNKEVQQETSDYYLKRFRIDNVWEDLTVELTINHYCAAYSWDTVEETPATCTETGLTKGVTCTICGRVIEERKEIPALGHDLKVVNTATCDTSGHIISTCQREGCTYKTVVSTPALGHDWGEPETVSATCTEGGLVKKTCKRDPSHVETVTSGPLGHDWEEDFTVDVQPTCETDGSKSRHCTPLRRKDRCHGDSRAGPRQQLDLLHRCDRRGSEMRHCRRKKKDLQPRAAPGGHNARRMPPTGCCAASTRSLLMPAGARLTERPSRGPSSAARPTAPNSTWSPRRAAPSLSPTRRISGIT